MAAAKGNGTRDRRDLVGRAPNRAKRRRVPIWKELLKIAKEIPRADLHKLPTDLAVHHDHYLAGGHLS